MPGKTRLNLPSRQGNGTGSDLQYNEASLPYELLALEAALAAHTKGLEAQTAELEGQAKPSLEHLLLSVCLCHTHPLLILCIPQECLI